MEHKDPRLEKIRLYKGSIKDLTDFIKKCGRCKPCRSNHRKEWYVKNITKKMILKYFVFESSTSSLSRINLVKK